MDTRQFIEASIERLTFKIEKCNERIAELSGSTKPSDLTHITFVTGERFAHEMMIRDLTHDLAMYNLYDIGTDPDCSEEEVRAIVEQEREVDYRVTVLNDLLQDYEGMLEVEEEGLLPHIESKSSDVVYRQGLHEGRLQLIQFVIDDLKDFKEWLVPLRERIMNDND